MNEQLNAFLQKRWTVPAATAVAGFGVGTLVGYMFTRRQYNQIEAELARIDRETEAGLEAEVNRRLAVELEKRMPYLGYATESTVDDEDALEHLREDHPSGRGRVITSAKIHSVGLHTDGGGQPGTGIIDVQPVVEDQSSFLDSESVGTVTDIRTRQDASVEVEGLMTRKEALDKRGVIHNVFDDGAGDEWDYKTEIESRDKTKPYVIHVDEYVSDEMGWDSQSTLTWYEKDRILTDSHDNPIFNPEGEVGLPLQFGHGSNDPNVVYIRNETKQCEYEIIRDLGSYQETVLGEAMESAAAQEELKHSHNMKFRRD